MNLSYKVSLAVLSAAAFLGPIAAHAATTPSLGAAATYGILSSTYTNTTSGTTVTGDVGFTTPPAVTPTGVHTNYGSGVPYATAGTDQGSALSSLASQACTFTFAPGAIDLATDTTHGPIGVYTPGVYCTGAPGAASIGTAGITLSGAGTYIFRINGALTSVANSNVTLAGASACDVFWTPTSATTLGANSTFRGIAIDAAGITAGANVTWTGMALAFGGTVTTDTDTITVPTCSAPPPASLAPTCTLTASPASVASGSPSTLSWTTTNATSFSIDNGVSSITSVASGSTTVSPVATTIYTGTATGGGTTVTCSATVTVAALPPTPTSATLHVIKQVVNNNGGTATASSFNLHVKLSGADVTGSPAAGTATPGTSYTLSAGTYVVSEDASTAYVQSFSGDCNSSGSVTLASGDSKTCTITNDDIAVSLPTPAPTPTPTPTPSVPTPAPAKLPNTGLSPKGTNMPLNAAVMAGVLMALLASFVVLKKRTM